MSTLTLDPPETSLRDETDIDPAREALEEILEERDKGPFVPLPADWKEQVMEKVRVHARRLQTQTSHA